jgi:HD-GYP domain-containing protein (c-di-GMP phosphodiesterase class II)
LISDVPLATISEINHIAENTLLGILILGPKVSKKRFSEEEVDFFTALSSDVAMAIRNAQLFEELRLELGKKYRLFIHTTIALAAAIDAKDHYTRGHTERVTHYSLMIAKKLMSMLPNKNIFSSRFLENLHVAALLHDIGKIGITETILNKNGSLTPEERQKIQEHPLIGVAILQPIKELEEPISGVKYHHERFDGHGYPEGLKGDKIPLIASVIAVADVFDALTTDRPYRPAMQKDQAVREIERGSGTQFNPIVVDAILQLYREGKI